VKSLTTWTALGVFILAVTGGPGARSAFPGQVAGPLFRSGADLVHLNVSVTAGAGRYVTGLGREAFTVFEDGVLQDVQFFAAAEVPLDLVVLLDLSGSMTSQMPLVRQAAIGLVRSLRPGDRASVVAFSDVVRVRADFTGDFEALTVAIEGTQAHGGTSLYDAIYIALGSFERAAPAPAGIRRRAAAVLSDGADTRSLLGFDDVLERARRLGVSLYTISLMDPAFDRVGSPHEHQMRRLARETGARSFHPQRAEELAGIYAVVVQELSQQYTLGYTPTNAARDGAFRRITVRVDTDSGAQARTRAGYFAPRGGPVRPAGGRRSRTGQLKITV
jgi:Ca-activated chloride channel homolog